MVQHPLKIGESPIHPSAIRGNVDVLCYPQPYKRIGILPETKFRMETDEMQVDKNKWQALKTKLRLTEVETTDKGPHLQNLHRETISPASVQRQYGDRATLTKIGTDFVTTVQDVAEQIQGEDLASHKTFYERPPARRGRTRHGSDGGATQPEEPEEEKEEDDGE